MNIALVNLMTKTADIPEGRIVGNPVPATDANLNVTKLAKSISADGHHVSIFVSDSYEPESKCSLNNVDIIYVPTKLTSMFPPAIIPCTPMLKKHIRNENFDVVQSGEVFQLGTYYSYGAAKKSQSKFFIWQELDVYMRGTAGIIQKQFYHTIGKRMAKCCKIIPRSRSAAAHLLESGFSSDQLTEVVHSGVDCNTFRPMNREECRRKFGLDAEQDIIIAVGRLHQNKGFDKLIDAAKYIKRRNPDFKLIIKGSGAEEESLKSLVQKSDLSDVVMIHTDYLSDMEMAELYNCANLYALCSRNDLFPFTAIEAMSCGIPIVSSFGRGIELDILNEGAGVKTADSPEDLAKAMLALLNDTNTSQSMSNRARTLALNEFDFNVCSKRLCSIYSECDS